MPDPTLTLAAAVAGWGVALALLVLWRRAAPYVAECRPLRDRAWQATRRAERGAEEVARLGQREAALQEAAHGLRAQLARAAEDRARIAQEAREERAALDAKLDALRRELEAERVATAALRAQLDERGRLHAEEIERLGRIRGDMADRFKALADETVRLHGDSFSKASDRRLRALLEPMRQHLGHFQEELRQTQTGAAKERERLKAEIEMLSQRSERIGQEAVALTRALKGDKQKQGAWGEMILERLLEESGLAEGREYETQPSVRAEGGGRRRPDVVLRLPGAKAVVIDAKVSLVAYEEAVNAPDDAARARALKAHVAALRAHVDALSARDYGALVEGSVDYVLMFMPVEGALAAALEAEGDLTAYAISRRVGIATPTTLMMALRTIQHVWAVERRESNAEAIAARAGKLFDKMAGVIESFDKVGAALEAARGAHDTAFDRLARGQGNLVSQVETLRRLGAATSKALPPEYLDRSAEPGPDGRTPEGPGPERAGNVRPLAAPRAVTRGPAE